MNDVDIENMLNDGLPDELKNKKVEAQYDEKFKTVLEGDDGASIPAVIGSIN